MNSTKSKVIETNSNVEKIVLNNNNQKLYYPPVEKIKTIIVEHFPALGKLAAMRFIEWTQNNSGSVISLPTGKTPEFFIKWVNYFLNNWSVAKVQKMMEKGGIDPSVKPDMKSFHFVQIDEFYPIKSNQHNSFYYYVNQYYIKGFGLDPAKSILINPDKIGLKANESIYSVWPNQTVDLSLRTRHPKNKLEEKQKSVLDAVDQFCYNYENKIEELGGIGFFMGGIGPDGHIGFNVEGSDHYSTTRLTKTNYETQAASAGDLGGIEISRNRLVITIGLQTIVRNPNTTAIIIAAGEAKAKIIKKAIQSEKSLKVPASVLQDLPNTRFYLTGGAAKLLDERKYLALSTQKKISKQDSDRILIDVSIEKEKPVFKLTKSDLMKNKESSLLVKNLNGSYENTLKNLDKQYRNKISQTLNVPQSEVFMHTAPHHDDIMLGYLPFLVRLMRDPSNTHFFNYLTSGFNAVTNAYMLNLLDNVEKFMETDAFHEIVRLDYFNPKNMVFKNKDMLLYLDGIAGKNEELCREGESRRLLRNITEVFEEDSFENLNNRISELVNYFKTQYPGKKDLPYIQNLKGMTREWEADVLWGYFGFSSQSVIHSRLGFYKGDIFTEEPDETRDVLPILETLKQIKPTIISVALDPEGSGPDTHYKVLQAITTALKLYTKETGRTDIKVWGYRNVWYRYHPSEANLFIPVTLNTMGILHDSFINSFVSQANASFPSYEFDGLFSGLAQKIQVEQYNQMATVLGEDFFYQNPDSRIRSTRGLVYLKEMNLDEFYEWSRELRKTTENI